MISELVIVGLILDVAEVLTLTRHSNKLLKFLVKNRMRLPVSQESYVGEVNHLLKESGRKTWEGPYCYALDSLFRFLGLYSKNLVF